MGDVHKLRRSPRPLKKRYEPDAPYIVERSDQDDGTISYHVMDERPETYRFVCLTSDEGGCDGNAKHEAEQIARGLNLLVQYGLEEPLPMPLDD